MFDIGFSELVLIGIVALVIFGPEELPRVARTAGHLLGRLRRYVADVKSDISREMDASEMKSLVSDVQESARAFQSSLNEHATSIKAEFDGLASVPEEVHATLLAPSQGTDQVNHASVAAGAGIVPPSILPEREIETETIPETESRHVSGQTPPENASAAIEEHSEAEAANAVIDEDDSGQLDLFGQPIPKSSVKKD